MAKLDFGLLLAFRNPPTWRRPWGFFECVFGFVEHDDELGIRRPSNPRIGDFGIAPTHPIGP